MPSFSGNNLKYIIPIQLTTPAEGRLVFYTGLTSPTESIIGSLFAPNVNETDGYQQKLFQLLFGTYFARGAEQAGYVGGTSTYLRTTTTATNAPSNVISTVWSDFTVPKYLEHKAPDVSAAQNTQNKLLIGYLLVFDSTYTGNVQYKQLTDSGMSVYFSLTQPT